MRNIFFDTRRLDVLARERFGISEDIMMENAASALEERALAHLPSGGCSRPAVLVLCGRGNNGADGMALARRICSRGIGAFVLEFGEMKGELGCLQRERAAKAGVSFLSVYELDDFLDENGGRVAVVVDCVFGSGFRLPLGAQEEAVIARVNSFSAAKISCDVPSGLDAYGNSGGTVFMADETVSMGALKISLFSDEAKDAAGKISVANLGVSRSAYEGVPAECFLLEECDARLPYRRRQNVNKGSFGHLACVAGEKRGAAILAGKAALSFGAGLVTLVGVQDSGEASLMASLEFPRKVSAVSLGMGLGRKNPEAAFCREFILQNPSVPCVLDADIFHCDFIPEILSRGNCIATPHPKEFCALLEKCGLGKFDARSAVQNRIALAASFCEKFPGCALILKGANVFICAWNSSESRANLFVNPLGTSALAKAGSGDVLSGMAGALLAQGYDLLSAAVTASIVHAKSGSRAQNSFSLTPERLIELVAAWEEK